MQYWERAQPHKTQKYRERTLHRCRDAGLVDTEVRREPQSLHYGVKSLSSSHVFSSWDAISWKLKRCRQAEVRNSLELETLKEPWCNSI